MRLPKVNITGARIGIDDIRGFMVRHTINSLRHLDSSGKDSEWVFSLLLNALEYE
ncbi:MAG: hypothetical protein ACYTEW_16500 [Planctomycetota bacterium]